MQLWDTKIVLISIISNHIQTYLYLAVDMWLLQNLWSGIWSLFIAIIRLSLSSNVTPDVVASSSSEMKEYIV